MNESDSIGYNDPISNIMNEKPATTKSRSSFLTESNQVRPKKTRSISPHSRLLRRNRSSNSLSNASDEDKVPTIVAVTSCRSDAYYHQKAPGSASKLPQKAPSALKLFHELATGVKDAYAAVGAMPTRPETNGDEKPKDISNEMVLWDFMSNLDFLLALVDEVAVDTATRGALKDDTTFKCLRDVIKKGNKVLETMLIRRERKYTLFFRLTTAQNHKHIIKMKAWNQKVEKAVGAVTEERKRAGMKSTDDNDDKSTSSYGSGSLVSRGRNIFVNRKSGKGRRATPTPEKRNLYKQQEGPGNAADDGFFANPLVVASMNFNKSENSDLTIPGSLSNVLGTPQNQDPSDELASLGSIPQSSSLSETLTSHMKVVEPKDELVDVIKELKVERENKARSGVSSKGDPRELKPNWQPKADVPHVVPKLPAEYIHRHRLMKQVINSLLDQPGAGPRDVDEENSAHCYITSITSRHSDKAGNGKTTLAVAAIQTVEIRERFSDGICWLKLGRRPLNEIDIRGLYEELHRQLLSRGSDTNMEDDSSNPNEGSSSKSSDSSETSKEGDEESVHNSVQNPFLAKSRRKFQGGELEGMKEDLYKIICKRKVLICLDDVWSVEDAHWFLFHFKNKGNVIHPNIESDDCDFRILVTTRQPGLLGSGNAQEVFVRIFSEHEAVKLLLASAGKRPYGGRNSPVFVESKVIVKGCGNSPLGVRLAGGMLGRMKYWTNNSSTWTALLETCKLSLEEATKLRSFTNAVSLIVDLSFSTIEDLEFKAFLRTCFVTFAVVFQSNDRLKNGKGIPKSVILGLFDVLKNVGKGKENNAGNRKESEDVSITSETVILTLEKMHLIERARPPISKKITEKFNAGDEKNSLFESSKEENGSDMPRIISSTILDTGISASIAGDQTTKKHHDDHEPCYLMHDSVIAIADDMAKRTTPSFAPASEDSGKDLFTPFRSAAKYIAQLAIRGDERATVSEAQFHEFMIASLTKGWVASPNSISIVAQFSKLKYKTKEIQNYTCEFLPDHLIRAKAYTSAGELLADKRFIAKRVSILGSIEATRRHVSDLIDMKKDSSKAQDSKDTSSKSVKETGSANGDLDDVMTVGSGKDDKTTEGTSSLSSPVKSSKEFSTSSTIRDASRRIVDEIYRIDSNNSGSTSLSLTMAFCLSAIGEGLVRCRQARDAMLRLEEAVGVYRSILGPYHIDVARALNCVAKSLVKLSENRVALLKFGEAARIYEACNATRHFDSISNGQSMASLLVDLGDYKRAEAKYEEVLQLRRSVNGRMSYQVARTHNEYAAILAKQGKLDEAIQQYDEARISLRGAASLFSGETDDFDDRFNTIVIDLNIASIKAKKGDIEGAIKCYEAVAEDLQTSRKNDTEGMKGENTTYSKHIVAAMSRIGSLKLKQRDNAGALEMFEGILRELRDEKEKSTAMKLETARAHIKCATIYRQARSSTKQAIGHLREALKLYTLIYGPEHRDTRALSASLRQWQQDDGPGTVDSKDWD